MQIDETGLLGLKIIKLDLHGDERGFFIERFKKSEFEKHNLPTDFFKIITQNPLQMLLEACIININQPKVS